MNSRSNFSLVASPADLSSSPNPPPPNESANLNTFFSPYCSPHALKSCSDPSSSRTSTSTALARFSAGLAATLSTFAFSMEPGREEESGGVRREPRSPCRLPVLSACLVEAGVRAWLKGMKATDMAPDELDDEEVSVRADVLEEVMRRPSMLRDEVDGWTVWAGGGELGWTKLSTLGASIIGGPKSTEEAVVSALGAGEGVRESLGSGVRTARVGLRLWLRLWEAIVDGEGIKNELFFWMERKWEVS